MIAKPMVDGLEKELANSAQVVRLNIYSGVGREMAVKHQVRVLPTFVILDGAGNVSASYGGRPSQDTLRQAITKLIDKQ